MRTIVVKVMLVIIPFLVGVISVLIPGIIIYISRYILKINFPNFIAYIILFLSAVILFNLMTRLFSHRIKALEKIVDLEKHDTL
jgi:hypothetical protein